MRWFRMTDTLENQSSESGAHETHVKVFVNRTEVHLEVRKVTGLQLKEAAIRQGAELRTRFSVVEDRRGREAPPDR